MARRRREGAAVRDGGAAGVAEGDGEGLGRLLDVVFLRRHRDRLGAFVGREGQRPRGVRVVGALSGGPAGGGVVDGDAPGAGPGQGDGEHDRVTLARCRVRDGQGGRVAPAAPFTASSARTSCRRLRDRWYAGSRMTLFVIVFLCALGLWWGARRLKPVAEPTALTPVPATGGTESTPTVPTGTQLAGPRFTSHGVRGRNHQVATGESSIHSMRLARGRSRRATLSTPARSATLGRELRALPSTLLTRELVPPRNSIACCRCAARCPRRCW